MEQQQPESSAGEMMVFGLIEQADRMGKSAQGTQRVLAEQIQELAQVKAWAVQAAVELQKRADAAIKGLEAERVQLHNVHRILQTNAVQAIHDAVRNQSEDIERQTVRAFAAPLHEIKQAAGHVRQNMKETSWLIIGLMLSAGLVIGLMLGYLPLRSSQNSMQEQLNRIEQYLAAQQQAVPAPAAASVHTPTHKRKAK
jgi:hypothetical protein